MKIKRNQKGFTLIEVVLVLAIGGLIFLLAFLAFQQVSRNRRDTQRRSDAGRIVSEAQNYYGDVSQYPAESTTYTADVCTATALNSGPFLYQFVVPYLCSSSSNGFKSPQGDYQTLTPGNPISKDKIIFTRNSNCAGGTTTGYKVEIGLESGVTCRDSQ